MNDTHFFCNCSEGRTGVHCESQIDYCYNVTCLNKGICQSLPFDYKCQCTSSSFSGRHCENIAKSVIVYQYTSKAFAFIAILPLSIVVGFIIIMDMLKYGFGIDPAREERDRLRRRRLQLARNNHQNRPVKNQFFVRRTI